MHILHCYPTTMTDISSQNKHLSKKTKKHANKKQCSLSKPTICPREVRLGILHIIPSIHIIVHQKLFIWWHCRKYCDDLSSCFSKNNRYYTVDRRFDSFFGWLRATHDCACNKWLPTCWWLQSSVNLQSQNWTESCSNSPKTEPKVTVTCSPKTESKIAKFKRK